MVWKLHTIAWLHEPYVMSREGRAPRPHVILYLLRKPSCIAAFSAFHSVVSGYYVLLHIYPTCFCDQNFCRCHKLRICFCETICRRFGPQHGIVDDSLTHKFLKVYKEMRDISGMQKEMTFACIFHAYSTVYLYHFAIG